MIIKDKGTNQILIPLLCGGRVKLPLTGGIFTPDITFCKYFIYYRELNNKLNRKYVEEIIIGEYNVCFLSFLPFPFAT